MHEVKIDSTINKRTLTGSNTDDTSCGGVSLRCCLYGCALNYLADLIQPVDATETRRHSISCAADRTLHATTHDWRPFSRCCSTARLEQITRDTSETFATSSFQTTSKNFSTFLSAKWQPLIVKCSRSGLCCLLRYVSCQKYIHNYRSYSITWLNKSTWRAQT